MARIIFGEITQRDSDRLEEYCKSKKEYLSYGHIHRNLEDRYFSEIYFKPKPEGESSEREKAIEGLIKMLLNIAPNLI